MQLVRLLEQRTRAIREYHANVKAEDSGQRDGDPDRKLDLLVSLSRLGGIGHSIVCICRVNFLSTLEPGRPRF